MIGDGGEEMVVGLDVARQSRVEGCVVVAENGALQFMRGQSRILVRLRICTEF